MNVDTKLPGFKSFMSENMLNNGGIKTTIDQSAVAAGEQANVDLNLNAEDEKGPDGRSKKKKKKASLVTEKKEEIVVVKKSDAEVKSVMMRLLNSV